MIIRLIVLLAFVFLGLNGFSQGFSNSRKKIDLYMPKVPVPSNGKFVDATKYLPRNYKVDGSVDYTNHLQKAIDENKNLILPNFPILTQGLLLRSNSEIYFNKNTKLIMKPNNKPIYMVLFLLGIENVNVYNANIEGDYSRHLGTAGEWGFGIDIRGSRNIGIYNSIISNCWGDGIYISSNTNQFTNNVKLFDTQRVVIKNAKIDFSRRNGITFAGGLNNILIDNVQISNTFGTSPRAAIDFEPNHSKGKMENIVIQNSSFINNSAGINFHLNQYSDKVVSKNVTVSVKNVKFKDQESSFYFGGYNEAPKTKKLTGSIDIDGVSIENVKVPINRRNNAFDSYPVIRFKNFYHVKAGKRVKDNSGLLKAVKDKSKLIIQ